MAIYIADKKYKTLVSTLRGERLAEGAMHFFPFLFLVFVILTRYIVVDGFPLSKPIVHVTAHIASMHGHQ
jgi:hypothetical protein